MGVINLNYQQMRAVANDIRAQAEQAHNVIASLQRGVNRLMPTWEGASQVAFQSAYQICQKDLDRVPLMLEQISQTLTQIAAQIEQAEQQVQTSIHTTITADDAAGSGFAGGGGGGGGGGGW